MDNGSNMALGPGAPAGSSATVSWPRATPFLSGSVGAPLVRTGAPRERAVLMQATAEARTALEEAVVAAAVAAQRARSLTVVLEEALAVLAAAEGAPGSGSPVAARTTDQSGALSPREREVLALVAEGRSNKAIAEALYVSPNTIKTHVASLLSKLHAHSRVQLAAIAARHVAY